LDVLPTVAVLDVALEDEAQPGQQADRIGVFRRDDRDDPGQFPIRSGVVEDGVARLASVENTLEESLTWYYIPGFLTVSN
jgi:hypothetical protein